MFVIGIRGIPFRHYGSTEYHNSYLCGTGTWLGKTSNIDEAVKFLDREVAVATLGALIARYLAKGDDFWEWLVKAQVLNAKEKPKKHKEEIPWDD